jgi:CHAD domain-containing protein
MGFHLSLDDSSIGEGFLRIAREQIQRAEAIAEDTGETPAKRVHEARRRAKKLRALLRLVRSDFKPYAEENAHIRDAARRLSGARDGKVIETTLADLMKWANYPAPPLPESTGFDPAGEIEALAAFGADMRLLLQRSTTWKTGKIKLDTLAVGFTDTYRKGYEAMRELGGQPSDTGFHEWRKHTKYHWNQMGLLQTCAEDVLPSAHHAAGALADDLGTHHDLALLCQHITLGTAQLGDIDSGFTLNLARQRQSEIEARIWALGRQVYAETPKAVHNRFLSYLQSWNEPMVTA